MAASHLSAAGMVMVRYLLGQEVDFWPCCPQRFSLRMGQRMCPLLLHAPARSRALQWQGHQQAACPSFSWGSIQPMLGAPPGTGAVLRAPPDICTPCRKAPDPHAACGNLKCHGEEWLRVGDSQTPSDCDGLGLCVRHMWLPFFFIFMVPNKKADYFPLNK